MTIQVNRDELESIIHLGDVTDPCPYLPDQVATFRFGDGMLASSYYEQLLEWGYRRNGMYVYRPVCRFCQECWVLRVPVARFRRSKSQRRVWNRGARIFRASLGPCHYSEEKARVYERYLAYQHKGEEEPVTEERYSTFLVDSCMPHETVEIQYRVEGRLAGVGILDRLRHSLSTVYFYFDPDFAELSPGTWSALFEIELARAWKLEHYYLGYYIPGCPAMNYKARFLPCEVKSPDAPGWREFDSAQFSF